MLCSSNFLIVLNSYDVTHEMKPLAHLHYSHVLPHGTILFLGVKIIY